jgi:HK97 family phage prohead protease
VKINIRADSVEIEGYVNAIERNSKPLWSRMGQFIERICKGAFKKALKRNDDVKILLNHDPSRELGSTKQGNLELEEDNIGLKARAIITDKDVIEKARNGDLVGWSFAFTDREVENTIERGMPLRAVKDLNLEEVSILDKSKTPAYDGTLIMARNDDGEFQFRGEDFIDDVSIREETPEEVHNEEQNIVENKENSEDNSQPIVDNSEKVEEQPKQQEIVEKIDYSNYETMIKEMKEEV